MTSYNLDREVPRMGERAQIVATWYLRFNGYFPLQGFILHDAGLKKQIGGQLTDADLLGIRLPHTREVIKGKSNDIEVQTHGALEVRQGLADFIIAEVSSEECKFNWIRNTDGGRLIDIEFLRYALRRFGYWPEELIKRLSKRLSEQMVFAENDVRIRLLSIGVKPTKMPTGILQIQFGEIFEYMKNGLFDCYETFERDTIAKKIVSDHKQWHPLICEIYNRLRGHKRQTQGPRPIGAWLFPGSVQTQ